MADERLKLAYDAGIKALSQQDATLGNLRNRATGLLSAAALVTSFSTGLGLINTDPTKGDVLPNWGALLLLTILVAIGILSMAVLWPVKSWCFGPDSIQIMDKVDAGEDIDTIQRFVASQMGRGRVRNGQQLTNRTRCYRSGVALLVAEVVVLVVALTIGNTA